MRGVLRIVVGTVAVVSGVVLLAAVATSEGVDLAEEAPSIPWSLPEADIPDRPELPEEEPEEPAPEERDEGGASGADAVIGVVLVIVLSALVLVGLVMAWRHRPRLRWRRAPEAADFEVLDDLADLADTIATDAGRQRELLVSGNPRNAIVECWSRLEQLVVEAGVEQTAADTSSDLTVRALAQLELEPDAISTLAQLYREARFSTHAVGEADRDRAMAALDTIHDGLGRQPVGVAAR